MESWIFREPDRFRQEREGIENLMRSTDWLVVADWKIENDGLCVDAVIQAHGHDYEVRLSYPDLFPHAPPIVRPRIAEGRWSSHQYAGANGALCLEYRPDNWRPEITGAQMIESAQRLLDIENPLGEHRPERSVVAPSAHHLTFGQELRRKWARWYFSERFERFLARQTVGAAGSFKFSLRHLNGNWIVIVHEAATLGGESWTDAHIPVCIPGACASDLWSGVWLNAPQHNAATTKSALTMDVLRQISRDAGHAPELLATDGSSPVAGFKRPLRAVLIYNHAAKPHLFIAISDDSITLCSTIRSERSVVATRFPEGQSLASKAIGIVGLGSAGSKIAVTLARMGARNFYLVDQDLFLPENIVRNALDWQAVGQHKVDAMAIALRLIAPDVQIGVSRIHLTGQESSASVPVVLNRLGDCDLVIDATADARVFNLLSAVSKAANKPLVWLEVFAGGIGGLIARSRPGFDPSPQTMRAAYLAFCEEHPAPPQNAPHDYAVAEAEGRVLTASDSDVSIIAHHSARLAVDTLLSPDHSRHPFSMYLIGLASAWVFEAPFATIPIATGSFRENEPRELNVENFGADNLAFLGELLKKRQYAAPASA